MFWYMNSPTALNIILSLLSSCNRRRYLHAKKCKNLATRDKYFTARTFPRFSFSSRAPICAGWSTITHLFLFALSISGIQNNLAEHQEQQLGPVGCIGDGSYWWPCHNSNLLSCKPRILPFDSFQPFFCIPIVLFDSGNVSTTAIIPTVQFYFSSLLCSLMP